MSMPLMGAGPSKKPSVAGTDPPTLVRQFTATAWGTVNLGTPAVAGNTIIVCVSFGTSDNASAALVDGVDGYDMTPANTDALSGRGVSILYYTNVPPNVTSVVVFPADGSVAPRIHVSEWNRPNDAAPSSVNKNTGAASSTVTTGSVSPVSTRSLIIACMDANGSTYLSGPTNGFTRLTNVGTLEVAYLGATAAGTYSTGWSRNANATWAAQIAAFGAP